MRTPTTKIIYILAAVAGLALVGCGKTSRSSGDESQSSPVSNSSSSNSSVPPAPSTPPPPPGPTPPSGTAPLSYEFVTTGNLTYTTPAITTDNILKVRFIPGTTQDNAIGSNNATAQATELSVVLAVNGQEATPTFTSSNYVYGKISEQSNVIDFSAALVPASPVTITVKLPKNDFYCVYCQYKDALGQCWDWYYGIPSEYQNYPMCRKPVFKNHRWSGKLIVQTSTTRAI